MYVEELPYSLLCATVYFDNLWKNKKENNSLFFFEFQFLDNILTTKKKSKLCYLPNAQKPPCHWELSCIGWWSCNEYNWDRYGHTAVMYDHGKKWLVETCILSTPSGIQTQDMCTVTKLGVWQMSIPLIYNISIDFIMFISVLYQVNVIWIWSCWLIHVSSS